VQRKNAYNTNDPEILLRLKRQEADALRDVVRAIHQSALKPEHIFKIARNALLAQCNVKKMMFVYRLDGLPHVGMKHGFTKITAEALQELPRHLEVRRVTDGCFPHLHTMGVEYVVPLSFKNEVAAWFLVAEFAESEAEAESDLIFIETIGNVVSAGIENRTLIHELVQQESLRRELELAEKIQKQLLTTDFGSVVGAEVYAENMAHHHIGGDFYDVITRGDKGFFLCIADVAGKGIGAALLMASIQAHWRALILSENELVAVVHKLHKSIHSITLGEQFVTFFIAHVRTQDGELDYVNAGHNPPVLLSNGKMQELKLGTIPLGILNLPKVEEGTVAFHPGDLLFLYTDGLVEQRNPADEMLGSDRVHDLVAQLGDADARAAVTRMNALCNDFAQGAIQDDDVTLMAVKFSA
jgi:sigma-B regulation protein RsbU (phosphoserine phosphatase)